MAAHTAKSLFDKDIESAMESLTLYDGVKALKTSLQVEWMLRTGIVFAVSALDTYFHNKVKYRVEKYSLANLPPALGKFEIPICDLTKWESQHEKVTC
jgi:hypothetical protein